MRNCPVCYNSTHQDLLKLEYALFDDLNLSGSTKLVQCLSCGMTYNRSTLNESDYLSYYEKNDHYIFTSTPGTGGTSKPEESRYKAILELITLYIGNRDPLFLDFGCGQGGMLKWLTHQNHYRAMGVEASEHCRKYIKKNYDFKVHSSLSKLQIKADVIILSHVLEHLYNPREILQELINIADQNTIFYLEVPLKSDYLNSPIKWQQLYFEHINHFGKASLSSLLESCSLKSLFMSKQNYFLNDQYSPVSLVCLAQKSNNLNPKKDFDHIPQIDTTRPFHEIAKKTESSTKNISIWGISQYTQLFMGTYPEITNTIKRLFDSSPAKIGRTIHGLTVDTSDNITSLNKNDLLLIPKGHYFREMIKKLEQLNFKGDIEQF